MNAQPFEAFPENDNPQMMDVFLLDWTLKMSRLLRFRVAVDAKTQLMCVAERTSNVVECLFGGCETLG